MDLHGSPTLHERHFAPLPKRARLTQDLGDSDRHASSASSYDQPRTPPDAEGLESALPDGLFGATSHAGKPNDEDELYPSLFADISNGVRLAAQRTTLFGPAFAAKSAADDEYDSTEDIDSNSYYDADYHAPPPGKTREKPSTAAERAKQQAALEALFEDERDRITPGSNKKKRKVPGLAQQGPAPGASDRDERDRDPEDAPLPAPVRTQSATEASDTALRTDFASAMVGVVKALGPTFASFASKVPPGKRAPYSARVQRTGYVSPEARDDARARSVRRKIASSTAVNLRGERDGPPDLVASARALAAGRTGHKRDSKATKSKTTKAPAPAPVWPDPVDPDSDIVLPNLYDPRLGPVTATPQRQKAVTTVNDAKAQAKRAITWEVPAGSSLDFTFACSASPLVLSRLDELEAERVKVRRARALLLERAKELEAARRDVAAASGALATTTASSTAVAKRKGAAPAKTYATKATQTDDVPLVNGKVVRPRPVNPPTTAPPAIPPPNPPPQKGKNTKGKKKRAAHANANNAHHRDNYVPSRLPGSSTQQARETSYGIGEQLGLVDPDSAFNPHPQLGNSPLVPAFAALDEWLCSFCETKILYGSQASLSEAIRKRKAVLKVRKRAQDRAKKAAEGHGPPTRAPPTRVSAGTQTD